MRNVAIMTLAVLLTACAAPAEQEAPRESAPSEPQPRVTESAAPTFWDLAPLGNGEHMRVHIDDRARAGDCEELDDTFATLTEDDFVEGFTHEVLTYIDQQRRAAGCQA